MHWRLLAVEETGPVQLENRGSLDELVLEEWLHLEQMDDHQWWMRLGDARVLAERDEHGVMQVSIERDFYATPAKARAPSST